MRLLVLLAAMLLAGCVSPRVAVRLTSDDGQCSATVVSHKAILTAAHCFAGAKTLAIDGKPVQVLKILQDGNDHVLVVVAHRFAHFAQVGQAPQTGDKLHMVGNPGPLQDLYREGVVYGPAAIEGKTVTLYSLPIWFGDSGAGLFDRHGYLVGVVSFIYRLDRGPSWQASASFPLAFTPDQWRQVQ